MRFLRLAQRIGLFGGLFLSLTSMVMAVLLVMQHGPWLQSPSRTLYKTLLISSTLVFALAWAVACAGLARRRKWENRTCYSFAVFSYMGIGFLPFLLSHQIWSGAALCVNTAALVGMLSRKIAFPHLKMGGPEPAAEPLISLHLSR